MRDETRQKPHLNNERVWLPNKSHRSKRNKKGNIMKKHAVRFTVDFINQKIIGTKASFDKASKGFGPIYEELAEKVAKHPDFALTVKEQKKHTTKAKKTYNGMDFAFMKAYISTRKNAEQIMKEYEAVKKMAEDEGISVYPFVKKWFLGEFDPDKQGFDMEKAKKEISDYLIAKAVISATPAPAVDDENQSNEQSKVA